jgi:hypothetical protein
MVMDVTEGTVDGTLEHEVAKASGVVATVDGGLHCFGDRIDHRIHGRCGVRHLLPWDEMQRCRRSPSPSFSYLCQRCRTSVADNVLEENVSMDETTVCID